MKTTINISEKASKQFEDFMTQDQKGIHLKRVEEEAVCPFENKEIINVSFELTAIGSFTPSDFIQIGRLLERVGE
jgi:hypothetical protein